MHNLSNQIKQKVLRNFLFICFIIIFTLIILNVMNNYNLIPKKYYNAKHFNIKTVYSQTDYNHNNIDDYSDFLLGARKNSFTKDYEDSDLRVIFNAFTNAGYSLNEMLDNDIKRYPADYLTYNPDEVMSFQIIQNLRIYFDKYAVSLTKDYLQVAQWQPGDIVFFTENHLGIVSDRRNKNGIAYVIYLQDKQLLEEDYLSKAKIIGHYRFDASTISKDLLVPYSASVQ